MAGKAGAIRAGKAFVEIFADSSKLVSGLRGASAKLKAFGASVTAMGRQMLVMGGLIAAPLIMAARTFSQYGDQLDKMSKRTGISVEALSGLDFAATRSGASLEDVEKAVKKMQKSLYDAERGLSTSTDALAALGLTSAKLKGLSPEDQFQAIARGLAGIADPSRRAALAIEFFGRSGTMLLPMLGNLDTLLETARKRGLIVSTEDATAAAAFTDAMGDLKKSVKLVFFQIGAALGKALTETVDKIALVIGNIRKWVGANSGLVVIIAKVAGAMLVTGLAMVVLGGAIKLMGASLLVLVGILKIVRLALIAITAPALLIPAIIGAIGYAILKGSGVWDRAVGGMKEAFGEFWGAIVAAVAAGDLTAAFNVVAAAIKLVWTHATNFLYKQFVHVWTGMKAVAAEVASGMVSIWIRTMQVHAEIVEKTANWMAKRWIELQGVFGDATAEQVEFAKRHIDQQSKLQLGAIGETAKAALSAEDKRHQATMANIDREAQERERGMAADLATARAQYQKALQAARAARAGGPGGAGGGGPGGAGAGGGMGAGRAVGTFNPAAIRGLLGPTESLLRVNKDQLDQLKRIAMSLAGSAVQAAGGAGIGVI